MDAEYVVLILLLFGLSIGLVPAFSRLMDRKPEERQ